MRLPGRKLTPDGRVWLESTSSARALHIFAQVVNLANEQSELLSLSTEVVGLGPFGLSVPQAQGFGRDEPGFTAYLDVETQVLVDEEGLRLGGLTVDWQQAVQWDPRPNWPELRRSQGRWRNMAPELRGLLLAGAPPGGLAPLLGTTAAGEQAGGVAEGVLAAARQPAQELLDALATADVNRLADAAAQLAGLGGGLTPSGDDYLIGVMHALWATEKEARAREQSKAIAYAAVTRTSELSAAWVAAAAKGQAAEHWHELLAALAAGEGDRSQFAVASLLRVGHTSGADALAGFLAALESRPL